MEKTSAKQFYEAWLDIVSSRKEHLLSIWRSSKEYTNSIKGSDNSVIDEVGKKLGLLSYSRDYYFLDSILYKQEDKTPGISPDTYWFRDIRIAFEHENNFKGGLYQEVSHLLITNCDLRVLVTYPNENTEIELKYLHQIIAGNRQSKSISDNESFMIIFGYETGFIWEGFVYKQYNWKAIKG